MKKQINIFDYCIHNEFCQMETTKKQQVGLNKIGENSDYQNKSIIISFINSMKTQILK